MVVRMEQIMALALCVSLASACDSSKKEITSKPNVIIEDDRKVDPAFAPDPAATEAVEKVEPSAWGSKVAATATELQALVKTCHTDWIQTLEPDNIVMGRPAVHAPDGVVTRMEKACEPIVTLLDDHLDNLVSKHPDTDRLLRHWTLFADLYRRAYRFGTNVGTSSKRRKLNHTDLVSIKKELLEKTIPGLLKSTGNLGEWNEENVASWPAKPLAHSPKDSSIHWRMHIKNTVKQSAELQKEWLRCGHNLRKKELFPRDRYLDLLGRLWRDRVARDRAALDGLSTGDSNFDRELRASVNGFYTTLDTYMTDGWDVAMDAFSHANVVDEPKLKLGKDSLKKTYKALVKAAKGVRIPRAG